MAERVGAEQLDGLSKKELVVLVQSVAPLELLQTNQLSGKPENVAKKATKEKIIEVYNQVFDEGLITSETDREAARLAKELELKAKIEAEKAEKKAAGGVEEEYTGPKLYTINITKKFKEARRAMKGQVVRLNYTGRLEDGTVFDSTMDPDFLRNKNARDGKLFGGKNGKPSERGSALQFKIGANQVIRGWDECIREMGQGECASVVIEPEWCYGEKGSLHTKIAGELQPKWPYVHYSVGVPPNAKLSFELELVSIV